MTIQHLSADSPRENVLEVIDRDACVIIDRVLDHATIDEISSDVAPYLEAASVPLHTGAAYHGAGAGANTSQMTRTGLIFHYSLGWLRQEDWRQRPTR